MIVSREFRFEAAHRLPLHGGKCKHLHGHSYRAIVSVQAEVDGTTGIAVDFGDLRFLREWIDQYLDHGTIVWIQDDALREWLISEDQKFFSTLRPPTAETLVSVLLAVLKSKGFRDARVIVYETEKCCASGGSEG